MKQNQFKKRRITPLALLSQVKKNSNQLSFGSDSTFHLNDIKEKPKHNHRYTEEEIQEKPLSPQKRQLNKIQDIIKNSSRKSSKNLRFHSIQRQKSGTGSSLSKFPSSTTKKRMNTEHNVIVKQQLVSKIKNRIQKCKTQIKKQTLAKRILMDEPKNVEKIIKHLENLWRVVHQFKGKKSDREIIQAIKQYVLDDEGDASYLESIYACPQSQQMVRCILFYERNTILLLVDLMINNKLKLAETMIKIIFTNVIEFYGTVYKDAINFINLSNFQVSKELKKYLHPFQKEENKSLNFYKDFLNSKLKNVLKFSKPIENFIKFHSKNVPQYSSNLTYFKMLEYYSFCLLNYDSFGWNIEFLQTCPSPYLHNETKKKYTLVLDLDETLIHYKISKNFQGEFLIRPYLFQFLKEVETYYQIGIFTCSLPEYADIIINHMKNIEFRLYRHHTIKLDGEYVKDLSRIGRDLDKVVMIDNIEKNYRLQKKNGILIRSWYGDRKDTRLKQLSEELIELAEKNPKDIREVEFRHEFN